MKLSTVKNLFLTSTTALSLTLIPAPASAEPVSALVTFFTFGGTVGVATATALAQFTVGLALSALTLALAPTTDVNTSVTVTMEQDMGDVVPLKFYVGDYATAGNRKYIWSWGRDTRFVTEVIEVSCLPQGLNGVWVDSERGEFVEGKVGAIYCKKSVRSGTIQNPTFELVDTTPSQVKNQEEFNVGEVPADYVEIGTPLTNYSDDGNRIYVKWMDGTQTAADPFLIWVFGSNPEYPWPSTSVGTGKSYAIVTTRYDDDTLTSYPSFLWEPAPLALYDWRKDDTNGGVGPHRWGQPDTYEETRNGVVIAYNLARGVYYWPTNEWVYGGKNFEAWRFPVDEWTAAANAADVTVTNSDSTTEPMYRFGAEIDVSNDALSVMDVIRLCCNCKFIEVGGRFKPQVDVPATSVFSITDGDIIATSGESFTPFIAASETYNAVTANYPDPDQKWASRDAPEYIDEDALAADKDIYSPLSVNYNGCPYANQAQRLQLIQLKNYRRMIGHQFFLPPQAYKLEPGDCITWNSALNQYVGKKFIVDSILFPNYLCPQVTLKELEPGDSEWNSAWQMPTDVKAPTNPSLQYTELDGLQSGISAVSILDNDGDARKPAVQVVALGEAVGIDTVHVQIRLPGETTNQVDVRRPYAAPYIWQFLDVVAGTQYQVRAGLVSSMNRKTLYTSWVTVTTPETLLTEKDFGQSAKDLIAEIAAENGVETVDGLPASGSYDNQIVWNSQTNSMYRWDADAGEWVTNLADTEIPDGSITIAKFATSLEPVTVVTGSTLPTIKSTTNIVFGNELYTWNGTAYSKAVKAADITGQLANSQIAAVAASKVTGQMTDSQIAAVAAAKLTGQLASSQLADGAVTDAKIAALAASKITGQLTDSQIAAVAAAKLTGQVTTSQIADSAITAAKFANGLEPITVVTSLPTSKVTSAVSYNNELYRWNGSAYIKTVASTDITGTLTNAQIAAVAASKITGQLTDSQIAEVAAAKLTGKITTTQITDGAVTTPLLAAGSVVTAKLATGAVTTDILAANAVTAAKILAGAVEAGKLAAGAVIAGNIASNAVTAGTIAANAVTAGTVAADAISTASLQAGAVVSDKIATNAVTAKKMYLTDYSNPLAGSEDPNAGVWTVTTPAVASFSSDITYSGRAYSMKITSTGGVQRNCFNYNGNIPVSNGDQYYVEFWVYKTSNWDGTNDTNSLRIYGSDGSYIIALGWQGIAAETWTKVSGSYIISGDKQKQILTIYANATAGTTYLSDFVIRRKAAAELIVDGAIISDKIAANAVTTAALAAGSVVADSIASNAITTAKIAAGAVETAKLAAGAVTTDKLYAQAVTADKILSGTITALQIASATITGDRLVAGTIVADNIASNAVTTAKIAAGAVETAKLAAGAVTTDKLYAGAVTTAKLDALAVTSDKIAANAITTAKLAAGAVTTDQLAANSVVSSKMVIANWENVLASWGDTNDNLFDSNANLGDVQGYQLPYGANAIRISAGKTTRTTRSIQVTPGEQYYVEFYASKNNDYDGTAGNSKIRFGNVDNSNALIFAVSYPASGINYFASSFGWTKLSGTFTVPSGMSRMSCQFSHDGTAGNVYIGGLVLRQRNTGDLIVDGAVTALKIASNSVTSDHIVAGAITANKIAAGSIAADRINTTSFAAAGLAVFGGTLQSSNFNASTGTGWKITNAGQMIMPDASVDTLQIKGNAVTVPVFAVGASVSGGGTFQSVLSLTLDVPANTPVLLIFSLEHGYASGTNNAWDFSLRRDNTDILLQRINLNAMNDWPSGMYCDYMTTGGYRTYNIWWRGQSGNITCKPSLMAIGVKR